jgi:CheY-specific phosphatase CheX
MTSPHNAVVYGTEDVLISLCNSVTRVLSVATQGTVHYSGMVQRITKTCLKPDIGCFVLFDGGFSGLVIINFSAQAAMEIYQSYLLSMGMAQQDLATSFTSDEVANVMGELMNQVVGDFTGKVRRDRPHRVHQALRLRAAGSARPRRADGPGRPGARRAACIRSRCGYRSAAQVPGHVRLLAPLLIASCAFYQAPTAFSIRKSTLRPTA